MDEKAPFISGDERKDFDLEGRPDAETLPEQRPRPSRLHRLLTFIGCWLIILFILRADSIFAFTSRITRQAASVPHHKPCHGSHPSSHPLPDVRPLSMSMCDYYTLKNYDDNTEASQKLLVQSIVDKAFVGGKNPEAYFQCQYGMKSGMYNGILRSGDMWGTPTDLRKYFDGSLKSTNVNGEAAQVNFFSGEKFSLYGRDYPAGNEMFKHMQQGMYKYIAPMLGCSIYGNTVDRYTGTRSLKEIHKYMDIGKDFEWAYFTHQLQLGATAAGKFSDYDSALFELYLVDKFGPKIIDRAQNKLSAPFENPELEGSILPPKFDEKELVDRVEDAVLVFRGWMGSKKVKRTFESSFKAVIEHKKRVQNTPSRVKRQDFSSTPPPLTTPVLAPSQTGKFAATATNESTSGSVPSHILPVALGAGIGAGLGVIIISVVIAYLVIRKKRIQKRKSMPQLGLKAGIEMKKDSTNRRVDRSEGGNVVGKPRDYDHHKMEEQELEPPKKGHKKSESVGVRSVRFSQHEG